jgi:hypothetical protein
MISRRHTIGSLVTTGLMLSGRAFGATFMSVQDAQKRFFPQATAFVEQHLNLDLVALGALTQARVPAGFAPQCWQAIGAADPLGWVLADRVVGKYELIDYAAAFDVQGQVSAMEVLVYRESHGAEIRNAAWRRQFEGRKGPAQIRFGDDIRNISGATLSCQHLTEGMQRLAAVVQGLPRPRVG